MAVVQHKNIAQDEIHPIGIHSGSDPGAIGAYRIWVDTSTTPDSIKVRNASDDGWVTLTPFNFDELLDVDMTGIADGDVPAWNSGSSTFEPVSLTVIDQQSKSANYTLVLGDAGKHILHPSSDANARTFTIPANASVAFPIGTVVTFVNRTTQVLSIAITTDTMTLAGDTATGTRSLAQNGIATALKISSTGWIISGVGLT